MTSHQYQRLEKLLDQAEAITAENPLLTPMGKQIQAGISDLQTKVAAEEIRAQAREALAAGSANPKQGPVSRQESSQ